MQLDEDEDDHQRNGRGQHAGDREEPAPGAHQHRHEHGGPSLDRTAGNDAAQYGGEHQVGIVDAHPPDLGLMEGRRAEGVGEESGGRLPKPPGSARTPKVPMTMAAGAASAHAGERKRRSRSRVTGLGSATSPPWIVARAT